MVGFVHNYSVHFLKDHAIKIVGIVVILLYLSETLEQRFLLILQINHEDRIYFRASVANGFKERRFSSIRINITNHLNEVN